MASTASPSSASPFVAVPDSRYAHCSGYEIHYMDWQPAPGAEPAGTVIAWHGLARTGRDMDALAQFLAGRAGAWSAPTRWAGD